MAGKAQDSSTAGKPPVHRLKYRKPWIVFFPTAVAFILLNYLVASTETDETGKWRILPEYVTSAAEERDNALRDFEEPPVNYLLTFEADVMGFLFRTGCLLFGGLGGIQLVLLAAWLVHLYELGVCVRICRECNASALITIRYCICTLAAGFAQLIPLRKAREAYLAEANAKKGE